MNADHSDLIHIYKQSAYLVGRDTVVSVNVSDYQETWLTIRSRIYQWHTLPALSSMPLFSSVKSPKRTNTARLARLSSEWCLSSLPFHSLIAIQAYLVECRGLLARLFARHAFTSSSSPYGCAFPWGAKAHQQTICDRSRLYKWNSRQRPRDPKITILRTPQFRWWVAHWSILLAKRADS